MSCSSLGVSVRERPRSERALGCRAAKPPFYHQSSSVRTATGWLELSGPLSTEEEATFSRAILSGTCCATSSWTRLTRLKRAKASAWARSGDEFEFMRATVRADRPTEKQTVVWDSWSDPRARTSPGLIR